MGKRRFRFISLFFRLVSFFLILLPAVGVCFFAWDWTRDYAIHQADREYREVANAILNVVRARYDLVQNYNFQNEEHLQQSLVVVADFFHRTARELELEVVRKSMNVSRAKDVFLAILTDVSSKENFQVTIVSDSGKIIYCPMLPVGFDVSEYPWVKSMMENESGSFRFTWRYPGEAESAERLMIFRLIQGWGWFLAVEAFLPDPLKNEYAGRQYQGLSDYITGYHAAAGGFAMILSAADQSVVTHPEMQDGVLSDVAGADRMLVVRNGNVTYEDSFGFRWRAGLAYFAPRQWVIAVTGREDQIIQEARVLSTRLTAIALVFVLLVVLAFYRLQRSMLFAFLSRMRCSFIEK